MSLVSSPFFLSSTSSGDFYSFQPTGSLRFENGDAPYMERTFAAGNRRKFTWSGWIKRGDSANFSEYIFHTSIAGANPAAYLYYSGDTLAYWDGVIVLQTTPVFRDHSAWYHVVLSVDSTQATASERAKIYVNGVHQTALTTEAQKAQNYDSYFNSAIAHYIGDDTTNTTIDGYLAEIYWIDGSALDPTSFAETKNDVWMPKDAKDNLTFGTNGFYLPFNSSVTAEGQSTVLYHGTAANRSVQGFGYKPDFLWIKNREDNSDHRLFDRVRGPSEQIASSETTGNTSRANMVYSFNSDGFSVGTSNSTNGSGDDMVAWSWDAGADQTPTGFGCGIYTGSGSRRPIRDIGFTPDLVWLKERDNVEPHRLTDSVRGPAKALESSSTAQQVLNDEHLTSFDSDGFSLGTAYPNNSGDDYVAWCWNAGDSDPADNDDGDITATVKASTADGFSIGTFTKGSGTQTVGHGLGAAPDWLMVKRYTGGTGSWFVYHSANTANPETDYLRLNSTDATTDSSTVWGDTAPTSSVFTVGSAFNSGEELLFYAWTEKTGYSKFDSYTGNGSSTGPSVTLGFRPAFLMIKRSDAGPEDWNIFDTTRQPSNGHFGVRLFANTEAVETNAGDELIEITSTGFQIKTTAGSLNTDTGNYIYMAFAGGIDTIAPVNTDGDIDSRVKASDDTGFSIVRYEGTGTAGATVGHGLSSAPDVIFPKVLSRDGDSWHSYHSSIDSTAPEDYGILLNSGNARADDSGYWNDTAPTSSVITLGSYNNFSGQDYIMYCWTATAGVSAFGSYTGNGNSGASGPSITGLGFRPGLVIIKNISSASNGWVMLDDYRDASITDKYHRVLADTDTAEVTDNTTIAKVEFTSDGFDVTGGDGTLVNTNGDDYIYMAFKDGKDATFFHDYSGNGNNFEPYNLNNYDVVSDSPTNSFCNITPLAGGGMTISEGNLKVATTTNYRGRYGYFGVLSGKWYYEFEATDYATGGGVQIGFGHRPEEGDSENPYDHGFGVSTYDGSVYVEGTLSTETGYTSKGANYSNDGDIYGIVLDVDNETLYVHKNGVYFNDADPAAGTGGLSVSASFTAADGRFMLPMIARGGSYNETYTFNFGQDDSFAGRVTPNGNTDENGYGSFTHPVPSGFLSMCTQNIATPAIDPAQNDTPDEYFNSVLYTGNGSSQAITGVGFAPDLVWVKNRSATANGIINDTIRGAGVSLQTPSTATEDGSAGDLFDSLDSDGFTVNADFEGVDNPSTNRSGNTYVGWSWLAGGTSVSNTDGSITSSVSANTKAGFSIVSYTGNATAGATVGHGLSSTPEMIIVKSRSLTTGWVTYHKGATASPENGYLVLNGSDIFFDTLTWNDTAPTDSVFSLGGSGYSSNNSGATYIAYCFHSVEGYSKFGEYAGNSSDDGTFVHTGFRPAFVLVKAYTGAVQHWWLFDNKRIGYNVDNNSLYANLSSSEGTSDILDLTSNGFKLRNSSAVANGAQNYIYIAFAEMPFKYAQAR